MKILYRNAAILFRFVLLVFGLEFQFRINQPSIGRVRTVSVQKVAKKKEKRKPVSY